jgi:small subunit ribosomal protein S5
MAELLEESQGLESTTVGIYRTAAVVKGGRRFSFSAMVVVGDRRGNVGIGYGKAGGVPAAIEKAQKDARKNMSRVSLQAGTLPHAVEGKFGASSVRLIPAAPGTGVIAGGTVRAVLEMVGVQDCLTKAYGSTNQKNLCKAAIEGLKALRMKEEVGGLRGTEISSTKIDELLSAGLKYVPKRSTDTPKAKGPVNNVGKKEAGGRGGNRRRRDSEQAPQAEAAAPAAPAPTEQAPQ